MCELSRDQRDAHEQIPSQRFITEGFTAIYCEDLQRQRKDKSASHNLSNRCWKHDHLNCKHTPNLIHTIQNNL